MKNLIIEYSNTLLVTCVKIALLLNESHYFRIIQHCYAGIAQLLERFLAKEEARS